MSTEKTNKVAEVLKKLTKKQLGEVIALNIPTVAKAKDNKAIMDAVNYTDKELKKNPNKVMKKDLYDLALDIANFLKGQFMFSTAEKDKLVVENSTKPKLNTKKDGAGQPKAEPKPEPKAEAQQKDSKPKVKKAPAQEKDATADMFPDTIQFHDMTATLAHGIKSLEDVEKAFNENRQVLFAFRWTKIHLKQFQYGDPLLPAPKEGFENDLDVSQVLYVSEGDNKRVCYALSETENLYQIMRPDIEECDNGVRYHNGIEYQIYQTEPLEDEEATE